MQISIFAGEYHVNEVIMNSQPFNTNQLYGFLPPDIKGVEMLAELALDLRWSWDHAADQIWSQLHADLWEHTHNPWLVLQTISHDELRRQLADAAFREKINKLLQSNQVAISTAAWFQQNYQDSPLSCVAYFSMEFMLCEALPIYVGGLGNVAGDQLKSASDLGVPVVAVGLLYQQGYFRQEIDTDGNQVAFFPYNDPGQLPVIPLRLPNGEWLRLQVSLGSQKVWLRTWEVRVGRLKLYLLDSNDAANLPVHRGITNEVYGGGPAQRIQQEIILGIGGWQLLRALGIKPEVCHLNEGHAAFLILARASDYMKETGTTFETALAVTRAGNLFTTHTAVAAGFDYFSPALMEQYFNNYVKEELNIELNELMALGRIYPDNFSEWFNMAHFAVRGSGSVNAVSKLHGAVSRSLFQCLYPRWPVEEVPVGWVTNGVHMPSWDSELSDKIWTETCGKERWRGNLETIEQDILKLTDEQLWQFRNGSRKNLVDYCCKKWQRQIAASSQTAEPEFQAATVLDPNTLTLAFGRRFVPYKRPNLLLHDEERLVRILTDEKRPVQLIIAGKAPPFDDAGKELIRQWIQFIKRHQLYGHVVFLSDYDMLVTENMVQGADVWVNTPRRPWEACGTSGMKALVNGGINLSELDGWWAEAYIPEVGWAIGDRKEHGDDQANDASEAEELYNLLEQQVIPEFYERDERGIPLRWVARMRNSMARLTPQFSANRSVREYTEKYYLACAANYLERSADNGAIGVTITTIRKALREKWKGMQFGRLKVTPQSEFLGFDLTISLNGINPDLISVQLYGEGLNGNKPEIINMDRCPPTENSKQENYQAQFLSIRPAADYTPRIIPNFQGVSVPLEEQLILWQR